MNVTKDDTLKFRMDAVTADLMERARSYVNLDKSKFVRHSIREKAEAIIAEHEKTLFTQEDWHVFFDMLDNPSEPTERMKKASEKYKKITASYAI
ncbi:MAG: DUF1778 domain-containing protein [Gammaproteobacteria bacterium]|nr:MAG: DUF1778 domain-containing protein [Gammaproteobacteria bacterium]